MGREGRRADGRPSEGRDNAAFLLNALNEGIERNDPGELVSLQPGLGLLPPSQMWPPRQAEAIPYPVPLATREGDGLSDGRGQPGGLARAAAAQRDPRRPPPAPQAPRGSVCHGQERAALG